MAAQVVGGDEEPGLGPRSADVFVATDVFGEAGGDQDGCACGGLGFE
jgi:hypothetical protein